MKLNEIRDITIDGHQNAIKANGGKLWFVVCGDNDFIGYWDESNFAEGMGWEDDETAQINAMEKGDTLERFSSSMHTIVCVS